MRLVLAIRYQLIIAGALSAFFGCSGALGPSDIRGVWGQEVFGTQLTVSGNNAILEMPCLHGEFTLPSRFESGGRFDVQGTAIGVGGAPPLEPREPQSARFVGQVRGNVMTLQVNPDPNVIDTPFQLRRGVRVEVFGCP